MCGETYDLSNGIDNWFARFVVCFQPENERGGGLTSERLYCYVEVNKGSTSLCLGRKELTENKGEENRLPAQEVTKNNFGGVRLAFRHSANS